MGSKVVKKKSLFTRVKFFYEEKKKGFILNIVFIYAWDICKQEETQQIQDESVKGLNCRSKHVKSGHFLANYRPTQSPHFMISAKSH